MTPESALERDGIALLRALGFAVYRLSQGYRKQRGGTRQTIGIPDVYAIHQHKGVTIWWEAKTEKRAHDTRLLLMRPLHTIPKSKASAFRTAIAQRDFGRQCEKAGQPYAYGDMVDLMAELRRIGFQLPQLPEQRRAA